MKPGDKGQKYRIKKADGTLSEEMVTADESKPIPVLPGETLVMDQDGAAVPSADGEVFKNRDGFDLVVSSGDNGEVLIEAQPGAEMARAAELGPAVNPHNPQAGAIPLYIMGRQLDQRLVGGWKSRSWAAAKQNWKPLSDWAQKQVRR